MEWITRLNQAVSYIEEHLAEEIDYGELAKIACCSTYHFQRMFAYLADAPLGEYIRRRRMSLAAAELLDGGAKIIDVALKYGYSSPTAFNRAFQSAHGIAPSLAKEGGVPLKSFPPISFNITIKGAAEMNYRIEKKPAFWVVGVSMPLEQEIERNFQVVPAMWQRLASDGTIPRLAGLMDGEPKGMLGISACNDREEWRYFVAVASSAPAGDFEKYQVGAFTWAIFSGQGTGQSIQELEKRIVAEWLPTSGYEYANGPDIEVYLNPDPRDAQYEVWIPIVKKA